MVAPFTGDARIAASSAHRFSRRLEKLGFKVIDCEQVLGAKVLDRFPQNGFIDDAARNALREKFGADGAILGEIVCVEEVSKVRAGCFLRLISLQTGETLWQVNVDDDKGLGWQRKTDKLLSRIIDEAAEWLEKDLKKLRDEQKRERSQQEKTQRALERGKRRAEKAAKKQEQTPADNQPPESAPPEETPPQETTPEEQPPTTPSAPDQPPAEPPTNP